MSKMKDLYQTEDWKTEKHVPVIEIRGNPEKGENTEIKISVGKEIDHPNTTEHHIRWIQVLFKPERGKFPYEIGRFEFSAHGESVKGPNESGVYTHHAVRCIIRTEKPGTIIANSYCNIHGLWTNEEKLKF